LIAVSKKKRIAGLIVPKAGTPRPKSARLMRASRSTALAIAKGLKARPRLDVHNEIGVGQEAVDQLGRDGVAPDQLDVPGLDRRRQGLRPPCPSWWKTTLNGPVPTGVRPYCSGPISSRARRFTMVSARPEARSVVLTRKDACGALSLNLTVKSSIFSTLWTCARTR